MILISGRPLSAKYHGLSTDDNCVFRVKAVNAAGYSTYSAESEACVVKPSIGEYHHSKPGQIQSQQNGLV